ncbi:GNAT superfamily N-acetyltransferase [Paraburkholderia sp. 40]
MLELRNIAREFLAERERRRVLQVRAADLDDVGERFRLAVERVAQRLQRGQQMLDDDIRGSHVHRGRKHVVRRLPAIHVIVRMHLARFAALAAEQLARAVGDHLVQVHVGLRARAGLPDRQRKFVRMLAVDDLVGRLDDRAGLLLVEHTEAEVDLGGRALDHRERGDQLGRLLFRRNLEVLQRALRLRAPQAGVRHRDFAERVALHPYVFSHG